MLNEALKKQLVELHKVCFNDGDYADFFFENRLSEIQIFLVKEGDEVLSACYARFFDLVLFGNNVKVPFLTGVATSPKHRYKGYAREVVEKAKSELKAQGYPFVLLHPFNHDFYRKLGFETINYVTRLTPNKQSYKGVVFTKMTPSDLPLVSKLYDKLIATYYGYKTRSLREIELLIGNSLKHGGFGYIIHSNGTPKGYVWCEDGNCMEALAESNNMFDGLPLPAGYTIPVQGGEIDYSMGAVLSVNELLKVTPYLRNASEKICFGLGEVNYNLEVKEGCFHSVTTTLSEGCKLTERELISICLGQGARVKDNPFEGIIPYYDFACYEIY